MGRGAPKLPPRSSSHEGKFLPANSHARPPSKALQSPWSSLPGWTRSGLIQSQKQLTLISVQYLFQAILRSLSDSDGFIEWEIQVPLWPSTTSPAKRSLRPADKKNPRTALYQVSPGWVRSIWFSINFLTLDIASIQVLVGRKRARSQWADNNVQEGSAGLTWQQQDNNREWERQITAKK